MLCLDEIIGVAYIVADRRHKCITKSTQSTILGKNQLNGLFHYVNLATTNNILDRIKNAKHTTAKLLCGAQRQA